MLYEAASLAIPAPADLRAQNDELLWSSAAELRVCGPFAALGYPKHGPICISGSRLWMPRRARGETRVASRRGAVDDQVEAFKEFEGHEWYGGGVATTVATRRAAVMEGRMCA